MGANSDIGASKVLRKQVYFHRKLNGKPVYGISRIVVTIGQEEQIDDYYSVYKDIVEENPVKIKDFDSAYSELKQQNGLLTVDADAKEVHINKVELVYWEDSSPYSQQTHIQPVYRFIGESLSSEGKKGKFEAFVGAVPEILTSQVEQDVTVESTPKVPKSTVPRPSNKPE